MFETLERERHCGGCFCSARRPLYHRSAEHRSGDLFDDSQLRKDIPEAMVDLMATRITRR